MSEALEEGLEVQLDFDKIGKIGRAGIRWFQLCCRTPTRRCALHRLRKRRGLSRDPRRGSAVLYSTSREQIWHKGATSGDVLDLVEVAVNCEQNSLIYKVRKAGTGVCHTKDEAGQTRQTCYYRAVEDAETPASPDADPPRFRRVRRSGSRPHGGAGVGRGPGGSHHPRRRIRPSRRRRRGFLLESVDNGDRWSRWSFIGRRPQGTLVSKDGRLQVIGDLGIDIDPEEGMLTALERLLAHYRSPELDDLPPLHGGLIGYLGYDVVREVEHLPNVPADDLGHPDAVISMIGELAVYDHWRQRVTLLANVVINDDTDLQAAYDTAVAQIHQLADDGARAIDEPLMSLPDPPTRSRGHLDDGRGRVLRCRRDGREYILAGDIFQVVLSQRFDLDLDAEAFDLYRVLRQVNPSPYMYFLRHGDLEVVGGSPEPMVQLLDNRVISRPIAGTRKRQTEEHEPAGRRAHRAPQGNRRARHARRPCPQRCRPRGRVRLAPDRRDDDAGKVQPRYAPHVAGERRAAEGRSAIDVLRATLPPARSREHRRCGRWRSSTNSNR